MKIPPIIPADAHECHGPCRQGRLPCPTPDACERPNPNDEDDRIVRAVVLAIVGVMVMATLTLSLLGTYKS